MNKKKTNHDKEYKAMGLRAHLVQEVIRQDVATIDVGSEFDAIEAAFVNLHILDGGDLVSFEASVEDIEEVLASNDHGFSALTVEQLRKDIAWVRGNGGDCPGWLRYICY
jgi:hypothetical protein